MRLPIPFSLSAFALLAFATCLPVPASAAQAWIIHPLGTDFDLNGVVWTGSRLVAVGGAYSGENVVYTSPDGDTWTRRPIANTTDDGLNAVCWTGSQLVAVGPEGNVLTSPDGIAWTQRPNAVAESWVGVAWLGGKLAAVTGVGRVLTSADGITWETRFGGTGGAHADFNSIAWNGSLAVATAGSGYQVSDGEVYTSPDGIAWTRRAAAKAPGLHAAAWTGSFWAAVGGVFDATGDKTGSLLGATSPDGLAWTADPDSGEEILESVAWAGNRLLAVGWDGARLASADGSHWTRMAADTLPRLQSVIWTGTQAVAVGWSSTIVTLPPEPVSLGARTPSVRRDPEEGPGAAYGASGRRLPAAGGSGARIKSYFMGSGR